MATVTKMTRTREDEVVNKEAWFSNAAALTAVGDSDIFLMPINEITAIGGKFTVSGVTGTIEQTQEGTAIAKEIRTFSATHAADADGYVTITLNGVIFNVAVLAGDSTTVIGGKVRAATNVPAGWVVTGATTDAIFTADVNGVRAGVYAVSGGAGAIYFSYSDPTLLAAGTGLFTAWNGSAAVNFAATAWKLVSTAGCINGHLTVKTK